jgi:hypothetical protein
MGMPGVPISRTKKVHEKEWALVKALTTIKNLQRLSINIDFCYHMLDHDGHDDEVFEHEHIRAFIQYMRSRMLKKGDALGTTQIHGYCRVHDEVEDKRYRFHSDEYGKSHLAILKSGHKITHHNHEDSGSELDDDELRDLEDMSDDEDAWEDDSDDDEDNSDDDSDGDDDEDMPPLEDSSEDEEMPHLNDDLD